MLADSSVVLKVFNNILSHIKKIAHLHLSRNFSAKTKPFLNAMKNYSKYMYWLITMFLTARQHEVFTVIFMAKENSFTRKIEKEPA